MLLVGLYATIRTVVNLTFFEKYPSEGVLTISPFMAPYGQREQDCLYSQTYYTQDGQKTRPPTAEEKQREKEQQSLCLSGLSEARKNAKVTDITQSATFLLLGTGVLIGRKKFLS